MRVDLLALGPVSARPRSNAPHAVGLQGFPDRGEPRCQLCVGQHYHPNNYSFNPRAGLSGGSTEGPGRSQDPPAILKCYYKFSGGPLKAGSVLSCAAGCSLQWRRRQGEEKKTGGRRKNRA
ncbi:hypothetical protein EV2_021361 [Malus domestica]